MALREDTAGHYYCPPGTMDEGLEVFRANGFDVSDVERASLNLIKPPRQRGKMKIDALTPSMLNSPQFEHFSTEELHEVVEAIIHESLIQGILGFGLTAIFEIFLRPTYSDSHEKSKSNAGATTYLIFFLRDKSKVWRENYSYGIDRDEAEVAFKTLGLLLRCREMNTVPEYVFEHKAQIKAKLEPMLDRIRQGDIYGVGTFYRKFVSENEMEIANLMDFLST